MTLITVTKIRPNFFDLRFQTLRAKKIRDWLQAGFEYLCYSYKLSIEYRMLTFNQNLNLNIEFQVHIFE